MRFNIFLLAGLLLTTLNACTFTGVATTAGAVGGIAAAREGGITQSAIDTRISLEINDLWFKYDTDAFLKLNLTVEQGRVLVTGAVQNPDHRVEAIRLAWQPEGVVQVINEVRIADSEGIAGFARDTWITGNLRAKMIFDRDVQSINYSIDTVQSVVFLMGIAQDQNELNQVIAHARDTGYVKDVISYVKLAGQPVDGVYEQSLDPIPLNDNTVNSSFNDVQAQDGGASPQGGEQPSTPYEHSPKNTRSDYQDLYPYEP